MFGKKKDIQIDVYLAGIDKEFKGYYLLKKDSKGLILGKEKEPEKVVFIPSERIAYIEFPNPKEKEEEEKDED